MIAYQTNEYGIYVGDVNCQPSPREPGVFLIPAGAIEIEPPNLSENEIAIWSGNEWVVDTVIPDVIGPDVIEPDVEIIPEVAPELTYEQEYNLVQVLRQEQYRNVSDPLFFGWQAEENTKEEWLLARVSIKSLNPYPTEETN